MPLVVIALVVLAVPAVSGAGRGHSTASLRADNARIAAQSRSAVLGLYSLDQRLAAATSQLATLDAQARVLQAQRASLAAQVAVARRSARVAEAEAAQQLTALYERGTVEPLEIVLGSANLDQAMTSLDNLDRVAGQGQDIVAQLKGARAQLAAASRRLADRERALAAATSRARATAAALEQAHAARTSYIASLAARRRLNDSELVALEQRAHAAQLKSEQLTREAASRGAVVSAFAPAGTTPFTAAPAPTPTAAAPAPAPTPATPATGGRTLTVSATGYALPGTTATGLPVGWGVVAVDPTVIPLGTHMTIPGYGEGVAADTGGAIVGATIDLWFPTVAQASAWGRRTVTIVLH